MQDFKEASAEIKVKTKRFSLKKGTIKICFELPEEKGQIRSLKLKLRNEIMDAQNSSLLPMERAFWDVVAVVDSGSGETYDAILGGLSIFLKLKLIFFPRWTRTNGGNMIYPFVNGKRQFNLQ